MLRRRSSRRNHSYGKVLRKALLTGLLPLAAAAARAESFCPAVHITPPTFFFFSSFGYSVDISGDRFIAGRPFFGTSGGGAAEVYRRIGGAWKFEQMVLASDGEMGDWFGFNVAIDGAHAFVGALFHDHLGPPESGAVYAFHHDGRRWGSPQELLAARGTDGDSYGYSIAISGDLAIIGAPNADLPAATGKAYVYRFNGASWVEEQVLAPRELSDGASFGIDVALCGNYAIVGASSDKGVIPAAGSAYVFRYNPQLQQWVQHQNLVADNMTALGSGDHFGGSVSIASSDEGYVAIVGAYQDDEGALKVDTGSAYIFRHDAAADTWEFEQEIIPRTVDSGDSFGRSVAIDGDWAVIGANHSDLFEPEEGAAFVYHYDGKQWNLADTLLPSKGPFFGWSVGLSGNTAIVSAHGEFSQSGAVYIYNVDPIFADLDCDNQVDGQDLGILLGAWGPLPKRGDADQLPAAADLDGNGIVNGFDLATLLGVWG